MYPLADFKNFMMAENMKWTIWWISLSGRGSASNRKYGVELIVSDFWIGYLYGKLSCNSPTIALARNPYKRSKSIRFIEDEKSTEKTRRGTYDWSHKKKNRRGKKSDIREKNMAGWTGGRKKRKTSLHNPKLVSTRNWLVSPGWSPVWKAHMRNRNSHLIGWGSPSSMPPPREIHEFDIYIISIHR